MVHLSGPYVTVTFGPNEATAPGRAVNLEKFKHPELAFVGRLVNATDEERVELLEQLVEVIACLKRRVEAGNLSRNTAMILLQANTSGTAQRLVGDCRDVTTAVARLFRSYGRPHLWIFCCAGELSR